MQLANKEGIRKARNWYRKEVILMLRPSVIKQINWPGSEHVNAALIGNYFKIAWRSLLRHRLFSFINLLGLAASMSLGLLMIAFIHDILQFDEFHSKKDHIYRLISETKFAHYQPDLKATAPLPLASILQDQMNEIEAVVCIRKGFDHEVKANNKIVEISRQFLLESIFMALLSLMAGMVIFQLIKGPFLNLIPRAHELLSLQLNGQIVLYFILFALFSGFLAGFVPARILSGIQAGSVLKNIPSF